MDLTRIKKKYKTKLFKNDLRFEAVAEATWKFTEHAMDHVAKEMGKAVKGEIKTCCADRNDGSVHEVAIAGYNDREEEVRLSIKKFLK
jgi:hypothetical protein